MKQEIRGNLARLLATENLTVLHSKKVDTAMFDAVNRVLTLPDWDTTDLVYEMLIGHETGHAIYTPHVDPSKISDLPADFINVVEDVRIEKRMKDRYPGMRRTFYDGYKKLHEDDFFDIKDTDIDKLNFLDKVNLYFKIGSHLNISFTKEERAIVDKVSGVFDFDEVVPLARMIYDYCKDNNQLPPPSASFSYAFDEGSGQQIQIDMSGAEPGDGDGDQPVSGDPNSNQKGKDENGDASASSSPSNQGGNNISKTMNSLENNIKKMVSPNPTDIVYVTLPELKPKDSIVSYTKFHELVKFSFYYASSDNMDTVQQRYNKFKAESKKDVAYLVKEFESKKAADSYSRIQENKTGVLDTCLLHTYKYNDDIFKKNSFVPEGKNHGLIFILDWSGSMQPNILNTCKQLIKLIWFCQRVSIPFDVYAFSTEATAINGYMDRRKAHDLWRQNQKDNLIRIDPTSFSLMHILSNSVSFSQTENYIKNLYLLASYFSDRSCFNYGSIHGFKNELCLGGTPLNESVVLLKNVIHEFKQRTRVQKTNCVILTDGEGSLLNVTDSTITPFYRGGDPVSDLSKKHWLLDEKLKTTYQFPNYTGGNWHEFTNVFLKNLKDHFKDVNLISFRLLTSGQIHRFVNTIDLSKNKDIKNRLINDKSCLINHEVYDSYFAIVDSSLSAKSINSSSSNEFLSDVVAARKSNTKIMSEFISTIA